MFLEACTDDQRTANCFISDNYSQQPKIDTAHLQRLSQHYIIDLECTHVPERL